MCLPDCVRSFVFRLRSVGRSVVPLCPANVQTHMFLRVYVYGQAMNDNSLGWNIWNMWKWIASTRTAYLTYVKSLVENFINDLYPRYPVVWMSMALAKDFWHLVYCTKYVRCWCLKINWKWNTTFPLISPFLLRFLGLSRLEYNKFGSHIFPTEEHSDWDEQQKNGMQPENVQNMNTFWKRV